MHSNTGDRVKSRAIEAMESQYRTNLEKIVVAVFLSSGYIIAVAGKRKAANIYSQKTVAVLLL